MKFDLVVSESLLDSYYLCPFDYDPSDRRGSAITCTRGFGQAAGGEVATDSVFGFVEALRWSPDFWVAKVSSLGLFFSTRMHTCYTREQINFALARARTQLIEYIESIPASKVTKLEQGQRDAEQN